MDCRDEILILQSCKERCHIRNIGERGVRFLSLFFSSSSGGKMDGEVGEDGEGSISRLDLAIFVNRGTEGTTTTSLTLFDGLIRIVRFPLPRIRPNSIRPRWKLRIRGAVGETPFAVAFSRFERFIVVRRSRRIFRLELFNSWKDALFQETLLEKRFSRVSNESSMYSRAFVYVRKREITRLFNRRFLLKCSCSILRSTFHPGPIARAIRTPHDSRFFYLEELARERSSRDDGII